MRRFDGDFKTKFSVNELFSGDIGSPTYANFSGTLQVVGVISFYPDARRNSPCQDGHYAVLTQLGSYSQFLKSPSTIGTNLS